MRRNPVFFAIGLSLLFIATSHAQEANLLAMGDWGYNTNKGSKQTEVARDLITYVKSESRKFDAMLTAGDNFYVHLDGIRDPKWKSMFEDLYDPSVLNFPFYIAMGNHDYDEDRYLVEFAYAQANPQSRWKMPARWYRVNFPLNAPQPIVSVLVLDSDQPQLGEKVWSDQIKWLAAEAKKPRVAPWLVVIAHHPMISNGDHGDNGVLKNAWQEQFEKAGVDFYLCGHDHDLQHLQVEGVPETFLLVGGGGATTRPMRNATRGPFSKAAHGFADLKFTPTLATVRLIGPDAAVLHEFTRTREGQVTLVHPGASDVAMPRTVKSITRDQD